jgi:hypothetical protein
MMETLKQNMSLEASQYACYEASLNIRRPILETIILLTKEVRNTLSARSPRVGTWKEPGLIYIGPSGENRIRTAAVMQKISHAAGYGGYSAVMGSKNLKAIVAKGRGPLPAVANPATKHYRSSEHSFDTFPNLFFIGVFLEFFSTVSSSLRGAGEQSVEEIAVAYSSTVISVLFF